MRKLSLPLLLSLLFFYACSTEKQTPYPLMGIASIDPVMDTGPENFTDITNPEELRHYRVAHGNSVNLVRDLAASQGLALKSVVYTGGFTIGQGHVPIVEENYRSAIAMSPLARLASGVNRDETVLALDMGEDTEWPFHTSTTEISTGSPDGALCFWIRIGDELMKVTGIDPVYKTLKIERGFSNSEPEIHEKGDRIFGPVYVGNRLRIGKNARSSNTWPTSPEGIRYALDPGSPAMHQFKADFVIEKVKEGYSGVWWDTFQPSTYNLCDPIGRGDYGRDGRSIMYWDFKNDSPYTPETLREAMKSQASGVRRLTREATGTEPYLTANNMGSNYDLLHSIIDPGIYLDGFCFEDAFLNPEWTLNDPQKGIIRSNLTFSFHPTPQESWEEKMAQMSLAARDGKETYSMIGPAGYVLAYFNPAQSDFERLRRYGWACFLLTVEASRTTMFGLPITFAKNSDNQWEILPLPEFFFLPLGDPSESKTLDEYRVSDLPVWIRKFEKGISIVSRFEEGEEAEVRLPARYRDPKTGEKVDRIIVSGTDGMVLIL